MRMCSLARPTLAGPPAAPPRAPGLHHREHGDGRHHRQPVLGRHGVRPRSCAGPLPLLGPAAGHALPPTEESPADDGDGTGDVLRCPLMSRWRQVVRRSESSSRVVARGLVALRMLGNSVCGALEREREIAVLLAAAAR